MCSSLPQLKQADNPWIGDLFCYNACMVVGLCCFCFVADLVYCDCYYICCLVDCHCCCIYCSDCYCCIGYYYCLNFYNFDFDLYLHCVYLVQDYQNERSDRRYYLNVKSKSFGLFVLMLFEVLVGWFVLMFHHIIL